MSVIANRKIAIANQLQNVLGFSAAATAGIMGNIAVETGGSFDFRQKQFGGGPGRGLFQFEGGHLKAYNEFLARIRNISLSYSVGFMVSGFVFVISKLYQKRGY